MGDRVFDLRHQFGQPFGDRVDIGAGAKLLGNIRIGNDAVVGANAVVICDVPPGMLAVGIPAVIKPAGKQRIPRSESGIGPGFPTRKDCLVVKK